MRHAGTRRRLTLLALAGVVAGLAVLPASAGSAWTQGRIDGAKLAKLASHSLTALRADRGALAPAQRALRSAALVPTGARRGNDDGLHLLAPPNGTNLSSSQQITFQWQNSWYNPSLNGAVVMLVATDPNFQNVVYKTGAACPASSAPACGETISAGPFPAGTYYWVVGVQFGSNPIHTSEVWSFTTVASTPAPPPPPPPGGGSSFSDPAGDSGGAPDITAVTVSNDSSGRLTFQVTIPGESDLTSQEGVLLLLDTDQNPGTGVPGLGVEAAFIIDGATRSYALAKWNGSTLVGAPAPSATVRFSNGPIVMLNVSELGTGITGFNLIVGATSDISDSAVDIAPDHGTFNYRLTSAATPPAPAPPAPYTPPAAVTTARSVKVAALPSAPVAGLLFRVLVPSIGLSNGGSVRPQSARCAAHLGGAVLRGTSTGSCTFSIPKTAGGKTLSVQIAVVYHGTTKNVTRAWKVHRS